MKKFLLLILVLLALQSVAQKKKNQPAQATGNSIISLTPAKWIYTNGKVEFLEYKNQKAMRLAQNAGPVVLRELNFKDGTIEFDIEPIRPESAQSIYFHRQDEKEQEIVYFRTNNTTNPLANDGIQYCPYVKGVNLWDLYPEYQAPAQLKPGEWNHIRLIISGHRLQVYVNHSLQPVLAIPQLEAMPREGSIAFEGASYIANLQIKPNVVDDVSPQASPDLSNHDANFLRAWALTSPKDLPDGQELSVRQLPAPEEFIDSLVAERRGLVNLTRKFGANSKRRFVWLQTNIEAMQAVTTNLQLGFSDEVWVFLNHQPVLVDKNLYQYNMRKNPDGRISIQNTSTRLNLRPGKNDLLIGVANDFYGWGLMARLESTNNIRETGQVAAVLALSKEIAVLDITPYTGTYRNKEVQFTLQFFKKDKVLSVQVSGQNEVPLQAVGHNAFHYSPTAATFDFDLTGHKVTLRQGASVTEFEKDK